MMAKFTPSMLLLAMIVGCPQPPPSITLQLAPANGTTVAAAMLAIEVYRADEATALYRDVVVVSPTEQPEINIGSFDTASVLQFFVFACAAGEISCDAGVASWHGCEVTTYKPDADSSSVNVVITALNEGGQPEACRDKLATLEQAAAQNR
jgi:hypothetical protein